jgi:tRNA modification GTPase
MNKPVLSTTIAALATAPHPSAVAIVRVSGQDSRKFCTELFKAKTHPFDSPRTATFGSLVEQSGALIDKALAIAMPAPHSYTGEDIVEFHLHGNPLIATKLLRALYALGAVPAEPGEYTKRAFLNGKIDLLQAEAVGDMISASSEAALNLAREQIEGRLSQAIDKIAEPLRDAVAEIEASLDFPEEDISPDTGQALQWKIKSAQEIMNKLISSYNYGHLVKEGFRVLLCGQPNVGKSSILNELLGKKRAIVSPVSGTTRDLIEESASFSGYQFVFCDSAGIRTTDDVVEKIGVELAVEKIGWADLVLFVVDANDTSTSWQEVLKFLQPRAKQIWMIVNKIDLNPSALGQIFCDSNVCHRNMYISAQNKEGISYLIEALVEEVTRHTGLDSASETLTNERQLNALKLASSSIDKALRLFKETAPLEVISLEIRTSLQAIEEIIGKTYQEDILGRIFSKFCIGK